MSLEKARAYLAEYGLETRIIEFKVSSATVALAAQAIGTQEQRIAKTLSFSTQDAPILIVCAGDAKVDNRKFKDIFKTKAKMIPFDEVEGLIGHAVGGVCPFGVNKGVRIYLDSSLRRFDVVYPAAGTSQSAVKLSLAELEGALPGVEWIDVTSIPEPYND